MLKVLIWKMQIWLSNKQTKIVDEK